MYGMKFLKVAARGLLILAIPIFCLALAISWEIATPAIYRYGFAKYAVARTAGLTPEEVSSIAIEFPHYFSSSDEYIDIIIVRNGKPTSLFTEEELIHFRDVKGLIKSDRRLVLVSLSYILIYLAVSLSLGRENWLKLSWSLIAGSGLTLGILLILALASAFDFSGLFLKFHEISFRNEFWSAPGYMLLLFPEGFWQDVALFTMLVTTVFASGFGVLGYIWLRFVRRPPAIFS